MTARTVALLVATGIACLGATPGAAAVPAQIEREPGLCRLLSSRPTGRTIRDGAMAKVGGIFTPIEPLPPVDVRDALYQEDLRYLLGLRCAAHGMGEMLAHAVQHGGGD